MPNRQTRVDFSCILFQAVHHTQYKLKARIMKGMTLQNTSRNGRAMELYLFRHGEAESQEKEAKLSKVGRLQAEETAILLLIEINVQGGGLLKMIHSPTPRAKETFDIMLRTIEANMGHQLRVLHPRIATALEAGGVIGPLLKRGIPYEETVEYWLCNPHTVDGKSPDIIGKKSEKIIRRLKRTADRLPAGVKIFYVGVTHEIPQAGLLYRVTGKKLSELGGGIKNCESIRVNLGTGSEAPPCLYFRGFQVDLAV